MIFTGKYGNMNFKIKITFSGVSDHSHENSINDKKNETKLNSMSWKIIELLHFQKKTFVRRFRYRCIGSGMGVKKWL